MRWLSSALCAVALAGLGAGCEMSDGDRCPNGYHYDPINTVCEVCAEDEVWNETTYACEADTDSGTDTGTGGEAPTGLGEPCQSDADCAGYEADFCAVNPMSGDGYCTIEDCALGECPAPYLCCDCTESTMLPPGFACLTEDDASLASSMGGCTCE